ncbi:hypothetical protein RR42_m0521 [Cupriavidus basilensis]|uniref:Uncharacterized protein n=1 Tax=Cupriavidus basilensis TaxID=68895 RepID=A0A0C4Y6Z6_9BURK|nr:hypothetical protein RR42_m0521 [Cupriavidus basilensis]
MPDIGQQVAHGLPIAAGNVGFAEEGRRLGGGRLGRRRVASHTLEFGRICDCGRDRHN